METWIWVAIVVAVAVLAVVALLVVNYFSRRRSARMRGQFGQEYDRTVTRAGNRRQAERELELRVRRRESMDIRGLDSDERGRVSQAWIVTQSHFLDAPALAVREADGLVAEVMELRGYPSADFEQRAADLSVDQPTLAVSYRAAHEAGLKASRGETTTEELRHAMMQFQDVLSDLVEAPLIGSGLAGSGSAQP
jgi:hypothetical protein